MQQNKFYTARGYQILESKENKLTASLEDYIEMIYRLTINSGYTRVGKLADMLNVKPSSVSKMLIKLAEFSIVDYEKYGIIKLTKLGREYGKYFLWRHDVINRFFTLILPDDQDQAFEEAELVEHMLSQKTVEGIDALIKNIKRPGT